MFRQNENTWGGVFTNLAAAQDWYIKNYKDQGQIDVTLIAAGGVADIYIIVD